jgi:DNA-binding SARP family transcriptional activator
VNFSTGGRRNVLAATRQRARTDEFPEVQTMEFLILGCLEARSSGVQLSLGRPREQRLLAALLLEAGRVVPLARLADIMWAENPPPGVGKQIQNAVSRLRGTFAVNGCPELIATHQGGYRLTTGTDTVDAGLFDAWVAQAQRAAGGGQFAEAARLLESALGLWRGPLLAGLGGTVVDAAAAAWQERRHAATEAFYDTQLALGRHRDAVVGLSAFVLANPLRDRPVGQLMLALYRCGRQADALSCYEQTRALLADELGLDPSPDLRRLRQQVLAEDPAIAAPQSPADPSVAWPDNLRLARGQAADVVPRQLPATAAIFVGRDDELNRLSDLLGNGNTCGQGGTPELTGASVVAVSGTAGVGKTTLAIRWAQRNSGLFPAGTLYVDLGGYDSGGDPLSPLAALDSLLRALGVVSERIPRDLAERSALFRTMTAERRVMIVLDNARSAAQVRPLLPGAGAARAIVTSRHRLSGLIVRHGVIPLHLDVLPLPTAARLVKLAAGLGVSDAEASELATLCGRLPLALAVAAERISQDPAAGMRRILAEMADPAPRVLSSKAATRCAARCGISPAIGPRKKAAMMTRRHPPPC